MNLPSLPRGCSALNSAFTAAVSHSPAEYPFPPLPATTESVENVSEEAVCNVTLTGTSSRDAYSPMEEIQTFLPASNTPEATVTLPSAEMTACGLSSAITHSQSRGWVREPFRSQEGSVQREAAPARVRGGVACHRPLDPAHPEPGLEEARVRDRHR